MAKIFKFDGEDFEVSEPKDCQIEVVGKGLTGKIQIHESTGMYRESLMGWGTDQPTFDDALKSVCRRILTRASKESTEVLCKEMNQFYKGLDN